MKPDRVLVFCIFSELLILTRQLVHYRLSTLGQDQMVSSDFVVSTLGLFRFSLETNSCQIKVQTFLESSQVSEYQTVGLYPRRTNPFSCHKLALNDSGLYIEGGDSPRFFNFDDEKVQSYMGLRETFITIDDTGVIRLESIYADGTFTQKWITQFRDPKQFILPSNNAIVSKDDALSLIQNAGEWGFSAAKGNLHIFSRRNLSRIISYELQSFILESNMFKDWNGFQTPLLSFEGLKYQARCGVSKQVQFRSPFVFALHSFWPQLRVLDQEGYELYSIRFPRPNCVQDLNIEKVKNTEYCLSWFCPPETFELNGKCLTRCPSPYFHQIKPNHKNRCVLVCEAGSLINNSSKICTCSSDLSPLDCPSNLTSTPFGCQCQSGKYYSSINIGNPSNSSMTQLCQHRCPLRFFEHPEGVCVSCPLFCLKCALSNTSVTFLRCLRCQNGYEVLNFNCRKKCINSLVKYSPVNLTEPKCLRCSIDKCKSCSALANSLEEVCAQCILPYALFQNICRRQCPLNTVIRFSQQNGSFYCELITKCSSQLEGLYSITQKATVAQSYQSQQCRSCGPKHCLESCQSNIYFHNRSSCFCLNDKNVSSYILHCQQRSYMEAIGIDESFLESVNVLSYDNFLQPEHNPCNKTGEYFNFRTRECLKCPFGCLTCVANEQTVPECTSCVESYYLSIPIFENMYCQKETSLTFCYQYNRLRKYCYLWEDKDQLLEKDPNHLRCRQNNSNCLICLYKSPNYCSLCREGYSWFYGRCLSECPAGFYRYRHQPVCLRREIENCSIEDIDAYNFLVNVDASSQYLEGYRHFTSKFFTQIHNENDPVGLIFIYYSFLKRKIQGSRLSAFSYGKSTCRVCSPGFGFDEEGSCRQCPEQCLLCVNTFESMCVKCHPYYRMNNRSECLPMDVSERPCLSNEFRTDKGLCVAQCRYFYKIARTHFHASNSEKIANCSYNCPNGMRRLESTQSELLFCVESGVSDQQIIDFADGHEAIKELNGGFLESPEALSEASREQINVMASCFEEASGRQKCVVSFDSLIDNLQGGREFMSASVLSESASRLLQESADNPQNQTLEVISDSIFVLSQSFGSSPSKVLTLLELYAPQLVSSGSETSARKFLSNSIYSLSSDSAMLNQILDQSALYHYSRSLTVILVIFAVINLGKDLDYKLDNLFILLNVLYLSLLTMNLNLQHGSYELYSWLYGFAWSTGLEMLSNPRQVTRGTSMVSEGYLQFNQNNARYLLTVDDCFWRNFWSVFLLWIVLVTLVIIAAALIGIFEYQKVSSSQSYFWKLKALLPCLRGRSSPSNKQDEDSQIQNEDDFQDKVHYRQYPSQDISHSSRINKFCLFVFENTLMGVVFYAVLQISSSEWTLASGSELTNHKIVAWLFLITVIIYFLVRSYFSHFGGLYTAKRIVFGLLLGWNPIYEGAAGLLIRLILTELVFCVFRVCMECPEDIFYFKEFLDRTLGKTAESSLREADILTGYRTQPSDQRLIVRQPANEPQQTMMSPNKYTIKNQSPTQLRSQKDNVNADSGSNPNGENSLGNKMKTRATQFEAESSSAFSLKCSFCRELCSYLRHQLTEQFRFVVIEELLLVTAYGLLANSNSIPLTSSFVICLILLFFLIVLADEVIVDLVGYSELKRKKASFLSVQNRAQGRSSLNLMHTDSYLVGKKESADNLLYLRIRNNFDYKGVSDELAEDSTLNTLKSTPSAYYY